MNKKIEVWKDIKGYEGLYQISSHGNAKSLARLQWNGFVWHLRPERILKPGLARGYKVVNLSKEGKPKMWSIHQLMAIAFLNHIPNGFKIVVDHIDEDKTNNYLDNLQLLTNRNNVNKGFKNQNCSSKFTGVHFAKRENKWKAAICVSGSKQTHLGYFSNEYDAKSVYEAASRNLHLFRGKNAEFRRTITSLTQSI